MEHKKYIIHIHETKLVLDGVQYLIINNIYFITVLIKFDYIKKYIVIVNN